MQLNENNAQKSHARVPYNRGRAEIARSVPIYGMPYAEAHFRLRGFMI